MPMTDPDLAQLESAATSAPWREDPTGWDQEGADRFILILGGGVPDSASEYCCAGISDYGQGPDQVEADVALIVAAVNALPRLLEIERAAMELDVQPCDFAGAEPKPGLRRWCLAHGEYDRGNGCPGGNLLVALARHNERGCTCDGDDGAHVGGCPALSPQKPTP